jgi:hypothetical protein
VDEDMSGRLVDEQGVVVDRENCGRRPAEGTTAMVVACTFDEAAATEEVLPGYPNCLRNFCPTCYKG